MFVFFQSSGSFHQTVSLVLKKNLVLFNVLLTVRVQAHQVGLDSFVFSSTTDVTYTPHLQDPHSEQKQQIEVFSHSVSPLFQPE